MRLCAALVGLLALHAADTQAQTPKVGIVVDPCADLSVDGPPRAYMEWIVSTDPAATLPARSPSEVKASDAARETTLHYDWANICRYRAANAALSADPKRVVFIGNSVTEYWAVVDPQMFARHNVNRGISGQITTQTLARFMSDVVALKSSVVHIWTGTNDIAGNGGPTSLAAIQDNVRAMVAIAKANRIAVVLGSITPARDFKWRPGLDPAPKIAAFNGWLKKYAADNGLVFADYHAVLDDGEGGIAASYSRDGVHPNSNAYAALRPVAERAIAQARRKR